jgi:hypothetical protein
VELLASRRSDGLRANLGTRLVAIGGTRQDCTTLPTQVLCRTVPVDSVLEYDLETNLWMEAPLSGAPDLTYASNVIWTGTELVIFGAEGTTGTPLGFRYVP